MNYKEYDDNELLSYIAENNEDASDILYKKYEPFIENTAKRMIASCKNIGLELNDLIQEGMVGVNQAIHNYNNQKETTFFTYAVTCIERRMISTIVAAKRQKHRILNESISIEYVVDDEEKVFEFMLEDKTSNPEDLLIDRETEMEIRKKVDASLTDLEGQVFSLKLNGFSYREIADILDKDLKVIDNALQRIKGKVKEAAKEIEL